MTIPDCTGCDVQLQIHCPSATCSWWRCANKACDHDTFDAQRGILLYRNGRVERLGV